MNLSFYDVDTEYVNYLRQYENKIPFMEYKERNKFLCGVVLTVHDINYFVPVSSNKNNYKSSFVIYDKDSYGNKVPLSSLRFSFMFPCPIENVAIKDINSETDIKYKSLTRKEYEYCNKHIDDIRKQAIKIYKLALQKENRERYNLCNFQLLEEKYSEYLKQKEIDYNDTKEDYSLVDIEDYDYDY